MPVIKPDGYSDGDPFVGRMKKNQGAVLPGVYLNAKALLADRLIFYCGFFTGEILNGPGPFPNHIPVSAIKSLNSPTLLHVYFILPFKAFGE